MCCCVAAAAATAMALQFTPVQSGLGGVVLGICAVAKYALTGRILGISGVVKGLVLGDIHRWRFAFLGKHAVRWQGSMLAQICTHARHHGQ